MNKTSFRSYFLRAAFFVGAVSSVFLSSAGAHAFLNRAEPAVGSTVKQLPAAVQITFTEKVNPQASSLTVYDASGKEVDKQDVHVDPNIPERLCVSLAASTGTSAGTYKVVWRAVAAEDAHTTHGDFTFRVEP